MLIWIGINICIFLFGLGFVMIRTSKKLEGFWLDPYGGLTILFLFVPVVFVTLNSFLYPILVGWGGYQFIFSPLLIVLFVLLMVYIADFKDNYQYKKIDVPVYSFAKLCIEKQGFVVAEKCSIKSSSLKKKEHHIEGDVFVSIPIEFGEQLQHAQKNIEQSFQEKYPHVKIRILALRE